MRFLSFILVLNFTPVLFSQNSGDTTSFIRFSDWSLLLCTSHDFGPGGSESDFEKLAPGAGFTDEPDSAAAGNYFNHFIYLNPSAHASIGLNFYNRKKEQYDQHFSAQAGLSYSRVTPVAGRLYFREQIAADTLVSTQTGEVYIVDSVSADYYQVEYNAHMLRLAFSCLYRLKPGKRWSAHMGIGIAAGFSVLSATNVRHYNSDEITITHGDQVHSLHYFGNSDYTRQQNKTSYSMLLYLPLGLDFRLGNESEFWKRAHLCYEWRIGRNFISIPELGLVSMANFQQGIGMRMVF
jgi:hypothetical protein